MIPEPEDRLDATATVGVSGPKDAAPGMAPDRLESGGAERTQIARTDLHGIKGVGPVKGPPLLMGQGTDQAFRVAESANAEQPQRTPGEHTP